MVTRLETPAQVIEEVSEERVGPQEIKNFPEFYAFNRARGTLYDKMRAVRGAPPATPILLEEHAALRVFLDDIEAYTDASISLYERLKRDGYVRADELMKAVRDELRVKTESLFERPNCQIEITGTQYPAEQVKLGLYAASRLKLRQILSQGLTPSNLREARVLYRAMFTSPAGQISLQSHTFFSQELQGVLQAYPELMMEEPEPVDMKDITDATVENNVRLEIEQILGQLGIRVSVDQVLQTINDWQQRLIAYDDSPSERGVINNVPMLSSLEGELRKKGDALTAFDRVNKVGLKLRSIADVLAQIIQDSQTLDNIDERRRMDVWVDAELRNLENSIITRTGIDFKTYIEMILDPNFDPNAADDDADTNLQDIITKLEAERNRLLQRRGNSPVASRVANQLNEDTLAKIVGEWIVKARDAKRKVGTRTPAIPLVDEDAPPNVAKPDIIRMYEKRGLSQNELMMEADKYLSALESSEEGTGNIKNRETVVYLDALQELLQGEKREYVRRRIRLYDAASYAGASKSMIVSYDVLIKGQDKSGDIWGGNGSNKFDEKDYDFFLREWDKRDQVSRVLDAFAYLFSTKQINNAPNEFYAPNYREDEPTRNKLWAEAGRISGVQGDALTIGIYLAICLDMRRYFAMAEYARGWSPRHDFAATIECVQKHNPNVSAAYKISGKGEEPVNFALTFAAMPPQWTRLAEFDIGAHTSQDVARRKLDNLLLADRATKLYLDTYAPIRQKRYQLIDGKNPCPTLYEFFVLRQADRLRGKPMTLKDYFKGYDSFGKLYEECAKTISFTGDAKKDMDIILKDVRNIRENLFSGTKALPMIDAEYRAQMILSHIFMLFKEYNLKHPDGANLDSLKVAVRKLLEEGATFSTGGFEDEDGQQVNTQQFFVRRFPDYVAPGLAGRGTIVTYAFPGTLARKYAPILSPHSLDRTWARTTWAEFRRQNAQIELPEAPMEEKKK
ncbi:MAG: hypothetical protein HZA34_03025 [Candidatus Pacebacteria bacterium]|nr:hypothetical protein [Candidatus Paceibacterota bacterium]